MNIDLAGLNWFAVLTAAAASFMIGGVWYAALFGKAWARAYGYTEEQLKAMGANPARTFSLMFVCDAVSAAVIAVIAQAAGVAGAVEGIVLGVLLWLGVAAANGLQVHLGSGRPFGGFVIDTGKQLVALAVVGLVIGVWR